VFIEAGGSPQGREFAAKYADSIIATATDFEGMKAYRNDVRARMEVHGRKPDDCKVLFLMSPILGDTEEEAHRKRQAMISAPDYISATAWAAYHCHGWDFWLCRRVHVRP
jgi:alkanesulfonate monooxygenase SsuD/methylene tetrahydromethanopterin reductase-like flavin-dependent oxidoreductase (luciferase family)